MTTDDLAGRVALVTGGGHGIGEAIVQVLASRGASVVVNDLVEKRAAAVAEAVRDSGGTAHAVGGDVSNEQEVEKIFEQAQIEAGDVDTVVNNAAVFCHKRFVEHTAEDWDQLFAVNVRGVFLCCRQALPPMIDRGRGCIVNIASISVFNTTADHVAYSASKAAVVTMTRDIASEVSGTGVRVNAVAPGPIDISGELEEPAYGVLIPRPGRPRDIGEAVAFLASDAAEFIVGETLVVAGGANLKVDR